MFSESIFICYKDTLDVYANRQYDNIKIRILMNVNSKMVFRIDKEKYKTDDNYLI